MISIFGEENMRISNFTNGMRILLFVKKHLQRVEQAVKQNSLYFYFIQYIFTKIV